MILDKVYELEGLLKLRQERSDLPEDFNRIIIDKIKGILKDAEQELTPSGIPDENYFPAIETYTDFSDEPAEPKTSEAVEAAPASEISETSENDGISANPEISASPETAGISLTPHKPKANIRFPINDRIRFSRELFNSDMKIFDSTIVFIESLDNWNDVEDYFYSELGWDPANKEVGEFICMLRHLFLRNK